VAIGRDYGDVAPTTGTYVGAPGGRLTSDRQVGIVSVDTPLRVRRKPRGTPLRRSVSRAA
jgi:hypothetical protein